MRRAAQVQRVAMATGAASADHDEVGLFGTGGVEQLLTRVAFEHERLPRYARSIAGVLQHRQSLGSWPPASPRSSPARRLRERQDPARPRRAARRRPPPRGSPPSAGRPARDGSIQYQQGCAWRLLPRPSVSRPFADGHRGQSRRSFPTRPRDVQWSARDTRSRSRSARSGAVGHRPGRSGGPTSANGSGAPSARTTATSATRGSTSPTTRPARAPTSGVRTASPGSATTRRSSASSIALWNGVDPILKERMFGLTNAEGNHGEDVKEYYFYVDATPTSSYLKYRYRYPLGGYPYDDIVATNHNREPQRARVRARRTPASSTNDHYVDVDVEYAKNEPEDIAIRITLTNRGSEWATVHVLPHLWFRNVWWHGEDKGTVSAGAPGTIVAEHPSFGTRELWCEGTPTLLFTENESNNERLCGSPNATPYVKDAFHEYVVHGRTRRGESRPIGNEGGRPLRLEHSRTRIDGDPAAPLPGGRALARRHRASTPCSRRASPMRTSSTGRSRRPRPAPTRRTSCAKPSPGCSGASSTTSSISTPGSKSTTCTRCGTAVATARNSSWFHMVNDDVISMPDKWEYPWYASWDLAFHTVVLAMVDVDEAKHQLSLMLRELYLHPSGQLPAYEWNFSDVNPPVHAWATLVVYETELEQRGTGDLEWLKSAFQKLLVNFTWWINRKDLTGRNVFEGGFLGLDNIGVFDRSAPLPTGGHLEQSDGTAWMVFFSQCMLSIALELAAHDADVPRDGAEVRGALRVHRRRDGPHRRQPRRALGRRGRLLLRRPPPARRQRAAPQGALDGRAAAVVRDDDPPRGRSRPRRRHGDPPARAHRRDARAARDDPRRPRPWHQRTPHARRARPRPSCAECSRRCSTRTSSSRPYGLRALSRYHLEHPFRMDVHGRDLRGALHARRVGQRALRRQLELARARCGSPSTT